MNSPFKGKTGVIRLINAFGYSMHGLSAAWQHESAFRQVALLACVGAGLAFLLPFATWGTAMIVASHLLCVVAELLNSAIEAAVDHTSLEFHVLAKRAKDLGSAAQFVCLVNLTFMWVLAICTLPPSVSM